MLNSVNIMGRLTSAPELKKTTTGLSVLNVTLACEQNAKNADGKRDTDFIPITAWRNNAEFISHFFKKGDMIAITGELQTRKYTDKDGNKRTALEVVANMANFGGGNSNSKPETDGTANFEEAAEIDNYDLPF